MKKCNKCLTEKVEGEFSKRKAAKDGLQNKCKECERIVNRLTREKHPTSKYYKQNPEYYKSYTKKWIEENGDRWKDYYRDWARVHQKQKYDNDPIYKLRVCIASRVRLALKSQKKFKEEDTVAYLGCTYDFLKSHIEENFTTGMSWDNYGDWEIDHIFPVSKGGSFHYSNLQPLWKEDNRKKGNRL